MSLRITTIPDGAGYVLRIAGRLEGEGVAELARAMAGLAGPLRLELGELRSADEAALEALRALRVQGVPMERVSRYLSLLLEAGPPGADRRTEAGERVQGSASEPASPSESPGPPSPPGRTVPGEGDLKALAMPPAGSGHDAPQARHRRNLGPADKCSTAAETVPLRPEPPFHGDIGRAVRLGERKR